MFSESNCTCLRKLHGQLKAEYYLFPESAPSYETFVMFFHKHRFSRKVLERRHILRDEAEILEYWEEIAAIEILNLISIDETVSSHDQLKEKYWWAWAIEGQKAIRTQFKIGYKHFSVMAAYSTRGFRHRKIVEGSTNGETFQELLREMRDYDLVENNECTRQLQNPQNPRIVVAYNILLKYLARTTSFCQSIVPTGTRLSWHYLRLRDTWEGVRIYANAIVLI